MERYALLDIDNCIANDGWRIPEIDWKARDRFMRYHAYHQLSAWDNRGNLDLFLDPPHALIIVTCRPVHYRRTTEEWLRRNGVRYAHLLMRNNDDHRNSVAVKRSYLNALLWYDIDWLRQVVAAFDDRQEIVDMYRECGINAERRNLHDVCAYINPLTKENHADGTKAT